MDSDAPDNPGMPLLRPSSAMAVLLPELDAAIRASLAGDDRRVIAVTDVAHALRRAGWPGEWILLFVRDRITRVAGLLPDPADPVAVERAHVVAAIECLRVLVHEPPAEEPGAAATAAGSAATGASGDSVRGGMTRGEVQYRPSSRRQEGRRVGVGSGSRRASGRQLQIRATPARTSHR